MSSNQENNNAENNSEERGFLEHLEDLRWHLIRAFLYILGFGIIAFLFREFIFDQIILAPKTPNFFTNFQLCQLADATGLSALCINQDPFDIINIKMAGQFATHIKVSLISGLLIGFPFVIWEFWKFIKPALYENEETTFKGSVFYSTSLFLLGVLFGYYVITPLSVNFLGGYHVSQTVTNTIHLGSYIATVASVALASGVIFELPILIYLLSKAGILTPDFLKTYRKHAIVLILAMAAIITPPDIFSQVLVCGPLIILYEAGIKISRNIERKHQLEYGGGDEDNPEKE